MDKNLKKIKFSEEKKSYERKIWKNYRFKESIKKKKEKWIWKKWEHLWK